jgi:hypothetical protein
MSGVQILASQKEIKMKQPGKCYSCCNQGQRNQADFYQTPYSMTEQLFEIETFDPKGIISDPACGKMAIVKIIKNHHPENKIYYIDLNEGNDFLVKHPIVDYIITNPPFSLAFEFIQRAKEICCDKFCMLLRLEYLHGLNRYKSKIYEGLKSVNIFIRRPMLSDKIRDDGKYTTGMITYAWYIWQKGYSAEPVIRWIDNQKYVIGKND